MDASELSPKKLMNAIKLQRQKDCGGREESLAWSLHYQLIRIRNESGAFVKGNWNENYAISAELEHKWPKVIDS